MNTTLIYIIGFLSFVGAIVWTLFSMWFAGRMPLFAEYRGFYYQEFFVVLLLSLLPTILIILIPTLIQK